MTTLVDLAEIVEDYDRNNPDLQSSHHFVFACPLPRDSDTFDYVVMGLNPGEQVWNWEQCNERTSETAKHDWILNLASFPRAQKWRKDIAKFCGGRPVLMSELFFWSSQNAGLAFYQRFGTSIEDSPHLRFCTDMNLKMLEVARPKAVILPGLSLSRQFAQVYGLTEVPHKALLADNGHSLVKYYEGHGLPWVFTKHWSGAFGFSATQRTQVQAYISEL